MLRSLQELWRSGLVPASLRRHLRPAANAVIRSIAGADARHFGPSARGPIVVSGFLSESLGIGRAGRLTAEALEQAGYEVLRHDIRPLLRGRRFGAATLPGPASGVWVLHCNPDEAAVTLARLDRSSWLRRLRIGYWAYELPTAPHYWLSFARGFHEIWAPSPFVAQALQGARARVRVMPHPPPALVERAAPNPGAPVRVLAFADFRSSAVRKNPMGAIAVFTRLYPEETSEAALTLKILRGDTDCARREELRALSARRRDVALFEDDLSDADTLSLIAAHDIFLSLHRSEGFGLAILEAMLLERAVLATGWSGNLAFMEGFAAALAPYDLVPVANATGVYPSGRLVWAEPDVGAAAERLRALIADPVLRARIGAEGRQRALALNAWWTPDALKSSALDAWALKR